MTKRTDIRSDSGRNLGVDLLRCAAMWMICCLHIVNRGGVSGAVTGAAGSLLWPLRIFVNCGVNVYALISGYVTLTGRFRPARVVELWLQVFFWNLVIAAAGELIQPHIMDDFWVRYLFPLTQKCFWYFTAYVGVYAFSPLINRGILALNPRQCRALIWLMLALFSLGSTLGYANQGDPWSIGAGYSVLWLLALYVVGACVRQSGFGQGISRRKLLLLMVLLTAVGSLYREFLIGMQDPNPFWKQQQDLLLHYTNPILALLSLCMLVLFARVPVGNAAAKAVRQLSPLTFGVYIIHVHHVNWTWMEKAYVPLGRLAPPLVVPAVLAAGLGLFLVCAGLDWLRSRLFRLLGLRTALDNLETGLLEPLRNPRHTESD